MDAKPLPLYLLSHEDRREAFLAAEAKLSKEDQAVVNQMANDLLTAVKGRHPGVQFSPDGALEVVAAVGIFLYKRKEKL